MKLDQQKERGKLWPLLLGVLGALNLFDFFYDFAFQVYDLMQGIGFLLVAPLAYFSPTAFSLSPQPKKLRVHPLLRAMAFTGLILVAVGMAIQWGWL